MVDFLKNIEELTNVAKATDPTATTPPIISP
jgi:hypothetical protein